MTPRTSKTDHASSDRDPIDDKMVKELPPPTRGNRITYDTEIKGFGVRVTAKGAKSFIINYRMRNGPTEYRYTFGKFPAWTVKAARKEAKDLRQRIDRGENPLGDRKAERAAMTVKDLAELYKTEHVPKLSPKSQHEYRTMLSEDILPALGKLKVSEVQRADTIALHKKVAERAPVRANRVLAVVSGMFKMAKKLDMHQGDNPCSGVDRNPEEKRATYLSQAEIASLSEALAKYPGQTAANVIRFLILTGARSGETRKATWAQIDLEKGIWTKPSADTKTKKEHRVPLSAPALQLLSELRSRSTPDAVYVFPGRTGAEPIKQFRACWEFVCKKAGLKGVRPHDLRHTYASILASAGIGLPLVGALLGHTQAQTTARYTHLYVDPLREATERVGAFVNSAGNDEGDVLPFSKARTGRR